MTPGKIDAGQLPCVSGKRKERAEAERAGAVRADLRRYGLHCRRRKKIYDFKAECQSRSLPVYVGLKHERDEEHSLHMKLSGCHGFCEMGPLCI